MTGTPADQTARDTIRDRTTTGPCSWRPAPAPARPPRWLTRVVEMVALGPAAADGRARRHHVHRERRRRAAQPHPRGTRAGRRGSFTRPDRTTPSSRLPAARLRSGSSTTRRSPRCTASRPASCPTSRSRPACRPGSPSTTRSPPSWTRPGAWRGFVDELLAGPDRHRACPGGAHPRAQPRPAPCSRLGVRRQLGPAQRPALRRPAVACHRRGAVLDPLRRALASAPTGPAGDPLTDYLRGTVLPAVDELASLDDPLDLLDALHRLSGEGRLRQRRGLDRRRPGQVQPWSRLEGRRDARAPSWSPGRRRRHRDAVRPGAGVHASPRPTGGSTRAGWTSTTCSS